MSDKDLHRWYLYDLGLLLKEAALEARDGYQASVGTDSECFEDGRLFAYFEVIDLLIQEAQTFGLPVEDLRLEGLDPYQFILVGKKRGGGAG